MLYNAHLLPTLGENAGAVSINNSFTYVFSTDLSYLYCEHFSTAIVSADLELSDYELEVFHFTSVRSVMSVIPTINGAAPISMVGDRSARSFDIAGFWDDIQHLTLLFLEFGSDNKPLLFNNLGSQDLGKSSAFTYQKAISQLFIRERKPQKTRK